MTDRLFGLASLALAGGYYLLARQIPASELADTTGPAGLPVAYAAVLAALSLLLLLRPSSARGRGDRSEPAPGRAHPKSSFAGWQRAALTLVVGALYVVVVPAIGYIAGITSLIVATAWAYGAAPSLRTAVVAVSGALVLWLLFVWLLGIPQPPGWWPDLLGLLLPAVAPPSWLP
jgi:hypothetical protein